VNEYSDPQQFVIKRRRKRYKFALFANNPLCFELEEWRARSVDVLEVGAGTSLFSVELASRYPDKKFVAIDVKADRLQMGARLASEHGLTNISFVRARADQLEQVAIKHSVQQLWLTFPDPFPKKRSSGRRMTHPTFLSTYTKLLHIDGAFYLKHDDPTFFAWSLEQLVARDWRLHELSFDLHDSDLHEDYKIKTSYEERWLEDGRKTQFVKASY